MAPIQTRRRLLTTMALAGAAGIVGVPRALAGEGSPETTIVRLAKVGGVCPAPQYGIEELLRAEGFTEILYVEAAPGVGSAEAVAAGKIDFCMNYAAPLIVAVDTGAPITILAGLPSAAVGALLTLWAFHLDLSIIAVIGILMLIGIVKKNAIMMIDFALHAQRELGMTPQQAIREACRLRFRPILMTTLAALLGALPLMLGTGVGSELRHPLGVTLVGGLLVSQLLTLFTTPVIYLTFEGWAQRWRDRSSRGGVHA